MHKQRISQKYHDTQTMNEIAPGPQEWKCSQTWHKLESKTLGKKQKKNKKNKTIKMQKQKYHGEKQKNQKNKISRTMPWHDDRLSKSWFLKFCFFWFFCFLPWYCCFCLLMVLRFLLFLLFHHVFVVASCVDLVFCMCSFCLASAWCNFMHCKAHQILPLIMALSV